MHPTRTLYALLLALVVGATGCTASIGGMGDGDEFTGGGGGGSGPSVGGDETLCVSTGEAGTECEVAADCQAPMVCLDGICVGPQNPEYTCSAIDGTGCQGVNEVCVANVCVINPGACAVHDDCPLGYMCGSDGQCAPERNGQACADPGPGPELTGSYNMVSVLRLREGLPGVVDDLLDVTEDLRDIVNGDIDLGLPSAVEFVIGGLVASVIRSYVPQYAINLVVAFGDLSDMLDTMTIEGTMQIQGQACDASYRVKETWQWISFTFRGQQLRFRPDNIPGVPGGTSLEPDEYSALYSCGQLYMDRHRVQDSMAGLVRFLVDTITQGVTGYPNPETALQGFVNCPAVGQTLDNYVAQSCSFCPSVRSLAASACQVYLNEAAFKLGQEIDEAAVEMSLIRKKGSALVDASGNITQGQWFGSLAGGDFPGTFTLQKN